MKTILPILTPPAPAPDGDLRLGRGMSELDGAAAFAALLSGALLHPAPAEGEAAVLAMPAGDVLTHVAAAEDGSTEEESESTENSENELLAPTADQASATVPLPLVAEALPTAPAPTSLTEAPLAASATAAQLPEPAEAPALTTTGEAPRDLRDAAAVDPATTALPNEGPALPAEASAGEPLETPRPPASIAAGSESAPPVSAESATPVIAEPADPILAEPASPAVAKPVTSALADSTLSTDTAFEPASDVVASPADAETQPSEPAPSVDPSDPATASEPTAPEPTAPEPTAPEPTAPEPTALPIDSGEAAPEPVGDDTTTEPTAPSADDAKPEAQQQEGSFEGDGQSPQDQAPDEPLPLAERTATPTPDQAEADPSIPAMSETADGPASTARAETPPSLQRTLPVAWLRAVLDQPLRGLTPGAAWQSLQIGLDDGEGTLTIQTRRDDDRVSVSVAFSDGHLRSLASASAERIQTVLQEHFGASVDLSLTSDGSGDAPPDDHHGRDAPRSAPRSDLAPAPRGTAASSPRARLSGARHEWVG